MYKKTLPVIAKFEDRLRNFHTEKSKQDMVVRRIDEVLCQKADKMYINELKQEFHNIFASKEQQQDAIENMDTSLADFSARMKELDALVKFQTKQVQKDMYSAVRKIFIQHQGKEDAANDAGGAGGSVNMSALTANL